jgi:PAS domain S-box-containing protein
MKYSIMVSSVWVIALLAIMQWTAYSIRKHVRLASLSVFPAALDSQRAGTAFDQMHFQYSDAIVLQEARALFSASREAAMVVSSLENAGELMAFNPARHRQIASLRDRVADLEARSRKSYAAAAAPNATPPEQQVMVDLARDTKEVQGTLRALQDDLANDFRAELALIAKLQRLQEMFEVIVLLGVVAVLYFSTRSWIDITVRGREDEILHQAQLEQKEERNMLRALIDNIPDIVFVKDIESRFVLVNTRLARTLGAQTPEELLGKADSNFFTVENADAFYKDDQSVMDSGQPMHNREETILDFAGNEIHLLTTKVPLRDETGKVTGLAGIGRDISARKEMEDALREAEQKYRGIFDNASFGVFQSTPDGQLLSVNSALAYIYGYDSPEEVIASLRDMARQVYVEPEQRKEFIRLMNENGAVQNFEYESFRKDGSKIWLSMTASAIRENGEVVRYEGMTEDISERKKMEDALREAERNYRGIFDKAIVGIFQSTPDGCLLSVNPAMAFTFGYDSPEEMIAAVTDISRQFFVKPKRGQDFMQIMDRIGGVKNFECEVFCKDGGKIWLSLSIRAIRENERVARYEGMCQEISERKHLQEQLLQAQKLESVGQLAAGIAHEINTPIQYIGDNVRFLKDAFQDIRSLLENYERSSLAAKGDAGPLQEAATTPEAAQPDYLLEEIPKAIEQTLEGVTRVSTLVSAMREFSHPGSKEKTPQDLNRAIGSTITVSRNEWKYVADMETDFDPSLPPIPCLPGELNQVILNLIVNAAHAIEDVVRAGGPEKGTIKVQTRSFPDWAEIRIQDSGTGIPQKVRTRVFDPFFTTKEVGKGTGQGLAIARSVIVDKHGGSIHFETEEGSGTTFIICLPRNGMALARKAVAA